MTPEMFNAINNQIAHEFYNSFVYLSISNFYFKLKMKGLGKHFKKQSDEEREHAQKFIDYLLQFEMEQDIKLPLLSPTQEWSNVFMPLDAALALEKTTTEQINELMKQAVAIEDYATQDLLQWYVDEQVQEEHQANDLIAQAKLGGTYNDLALLLINDKLDE